jgi:hypothetical protein
LVVRFVDPALRVSGYENLDGVFFGDLGDDHAGAWVDDGFEREKRWTVQSFDIVTVCL